MDAQHELIMPVKLQIAINNISRKIPNPNNASIVNNYLNLLIDVKGWNDLRRHQSRFVYIEWYHSN